MDRSLFSDPPFSPAQPPKARRQPGRDRAAVNEAVDDPVGKANRVRPIGTDRILTYSKAVTHGEEQGSWHLAFVRHSAFVRFLQITAGKKFKINCDCKLQRVFQLEEANTSVSPYTQSGENMRYLNVLAFFCIASLVCCASAQAQLPPTGSASASSAGFVYTGLDPEDQQARVHSIIDDAVDLAERRLALTRQYAWMHHQTITVTGTEIALDTVTQMRNNGPPGSAVTNWVGVTYTIHYTVAGFVVPPPVRIPAN